jgi:beta-barrel assembly-enhancing protease
MTRQIPATAPTTAPPTRPTVAARLTASLCALALLGTSGWAQAQGAASSPEPTPATQNSLPALGDSVSDDLSVGTERRIGDQIMRAIRQDPDYLDDPVLLEYLQSIWQPLVGASRAQGNIGGEIDQRFAWEPFLVRDKTVNAFALPGGYVGVHLGLIAMTATRDELASVLAHEMSHVTQRHIARGMVNSRRQSLIGLAGMILGVIAATRSTRVDGANAIFTGAQAASVQGQLNFSRDMEREADRVGFNVLTGAGFAPGGMAAMFEKLDQASHLNDSGGFPYLRTHPITTERIGDARQRLGTAAPVPPVSVLAHVAAQARARVMMDTRTDALRRWQSQDNVAATASVGERLNAAYASALASTLLHDWTRADAALQVALGVVRGSPRSDATAEREVVMLQAQSLAERGDGARAGQVLKPYYEGGATPSRAVLLLQAQVALASPKTDPALKRSADDLQTWTTLHPTDALAWQQLSRTWEQLGLQLRSLRADAESHYAVGDLTGAVDRLRAGQRLARTPGGKVDFIDASIIDARLRDLEGQRRRQMEEERRQEG